MHFGKATSRILAFLISASMAGNSVLAVRAEELDLDSDTQIQESVYDGEILDEYANEAIKEYTSEEAEEPVPFNEDSGELTITGTPRIYNAGQGTEGGRVIYVSSDDVQGNDTNIGDGSYEAPYSQLHRAISEARNGDTIVIKGKIHVNEVRDGNSSAPLVIDKNITIEGEGNHPSMIMWRSGIILGADVTFRNVQISFSTTLRNEIMANGHTLILDDVTYDSNAQGINLFAGGIVGYLGSTSMPQMGSHGQIIIRNGNNLGVTSNGGNETSANIYAGNLIDSLVDDVAKTHLNIPVTVTVESMHNSNYLGNFYAKGALVAPSSDIDFSFSKVSTPAVSDNYAVTGDVTLNINSTAIRNIDGDQGCNKYVKVNYQDNTSLSGLVDSISLKAIGGLSIASTGYLQPREDSYFGSDYAAISVADGGRLNLKSMSDTIKIGNFTGGGNLCLGKNQRLDISGTVEGTTKIFSESISWDMSTSGAASEGHTYIYAPSSKTDSFAMASPNSWQEGLRLEKKDSGEWVAVIDDSGNEDYRITKITSVSMGNIIMDANKTGGSINQIVMPITVNYSNDTTEPYLDELELSLEIDGVTLKPEYDEDDYRIYKTGDADDDLRAEIIFDKLNITRNSYRSLNNGDYRIKLTIPGKYMVSGVDKILEATATVKGQAEAASVTWGPSIDGNENFSNLVVFVNFSDTTHNHSASAGSPEKCFATAEGAKAAFNYYFDGDSDHPRAMKKYLENISWGEFRVANYFPQFDKSTGCIVPLTLSNTESYYNSPTGEAAMIREIADALTKSNQCKDMNLDLEGGEGAGVIDNLMIVVPADESGSTKFAGHKTTYGGDTPKINNLKIGDYNIVHETGIYMSRQESGLILHEFMHTLGYPDLYRTRGSVDAGTPVGRFCIMSSVDYRVQYPLAYLRNAVSGWLPAFREITESTQHIELYAPTTATSKEQPQAVIFKTPYNNDEIFVAEFRKRTLDYDDGKIYDNFSSSYNSGLIVYRVNLSKGDYYNTHSGGDAIYVFRPGDTRSSTGTGEMGNGKIYRAALSSDSNWSLMDPILSTFGSSNPEDSTEQNAITYSDGQNSGIVIKNVGTAKGDTITFDVEFTMDEEELWKNSSEYKCPTEADMLDSCMDDAGNIYCLVKNKSTGKISVLKYDGTGWGQYGPEKADAGYEYSMAYYGGRICVAAASNNAVTMMADNGSTWSTLHTVANSAYNNYIDITSDADGAYLALVNSNSNKIEVYKYNGTTTVSMGAVASCTNFAANISVSADDGVIAVSFREVFNNNEINALVYSNGKWNPVSGDVQGSLNKIFINNGTVYMMVAGDSSNADAAKVYYTNAISASYSWHEASSGAFATESVPDIDMTFIGDTPFIVYTGGASYKTFVKSIKDGAWSNLGNAISTSLASPIGTYSYNSKLIVVYYVSTDKKIRIKTFESPTGKEFEKTEYTVSFNACGGNVAIDSKTVIYGYPYGELPVPTRKGYTFLGWSTDETANSIISEDSIYSDTTVSRLNAIWEINKYKLSFDTGEAEIIIPDREVCWGLPYGELPEPVKEGYDFLGWFTEKELTEKSKVDSYSKVMIDEEHVLYAKWEEHVWEDIAEEDRSTLNGELQSIPKGLWVSGIPETVQYTGSAITFGTDMRVYYYNKLLKEGTDYTVKYSNNIKAGISNKSGVVSKAKVTITGKGNFTGSAVKEFVIEPINLNELGENELSIPDVTLAYNGKVQKGVTTVAVYFEETDKWVTLKAGTDFTYFYPKTDTKEKTGVNAYDASAFKAAGDYDVTINGKGNYEGTGNFKIRLIDLKDPECNTTLITNSKVKFTIGKCEADGNEVLPNITASDANYKPAKSLEKGTDYEVTFQNNVLPGKATAVITGMGDYAGTKVMTFNITAKSISKASFKWKQDEEYVSAAPVKEYTGGKICLEDSDYEVLYRNSTKEDWQTLIKDTDYKISYTGDCVNAGKNKATLVITGIGAYSGTLKKTFTIDQKTIAESEIALEDSCLYEKGGCKPKPDIKVDGTSLVEGKDYTLSYANNSKVADSDALKPPTVTVKGKGNYKTENKAGIKQNYSIEPSEIIDEMVTAVDVVWQKKGMKKPVITVKDRGGVLKAGTDYDSNIHYYYEDDTEINIKTDIVEAGTVVKAVIEGKGNYEGTAETYFRVIPADKNIAKATVTIPVQIYTGKEITLDADNLFVRYPGVTEYLQAERDFEIVEYSNNSKKGKAGVTIRGKGEYGGSKTISFTIAAASLQNFTVRFDDNNRYMSAVKKAPLASGSMTHQYIAKGAKLKKNSYKRTGYKFAGWNTRADGKGISYGDGLAFSPEWKLSHLLSKTVTLYAVWQPIEYKISYKDGKSTKELAQYTIEDLVDLTSLEKPVKTGVTFVGWYKDAKLKTKITKIDKGTVNNITLYPKFE